MRNLYLLLFTGLVLTTSSITSPSSMANGIIVNNSGGILVGGVGSNTDQSTSPQSNLGATCRNCAANCSYTGWYTGLQVGLGNARSVNRWRVQQTGDRGSNPHNLRGPIAGIHAGWGYQLPNNFYVGIEVLGNAIHNNSKSYPGTSLLLIEKRTNTFGAAPRLGYVWRCTMLYVRLGLESTEWKRKYTSADTGASRTVKKRLIGFVPGIGMSHNFNGNLIMGIEGTAGFYKKTHLDNFARDVGETEDNTFSNKSYDITLRLSYKF